MIDSILWTYTTSSDSCIKFEKVVMGIYSIRFNQVVQINENGDDGRESRSHINVEVGNDGFHFFSGVKS